MTLRPKILVALFVGVLWAGLAPAQPTPLSESQRKAASDLIVTGEVIATKKIGPFYTFDHCHMWQNYLAEFAVQTHVKGHSASTIQIFVPAVVRNLYPQKPCLQDEFGKLWLEPGQSYRLFLKSSPHADPNEFRVFHPSGIVTLDP